MADRQALVTGASGVAGQAFVRELVSHGWPVLAVSRSLQPASAGVTWIQADLRDSAGLAHALVNYNVTHVFHAAQMPPPPPIAGPPRALRAGTTLGGAAIRLTSRLPKARQALYRQLAISTGMYDPQQQNLAMLRNTLTVVEQSPHRLRHVVVVTGGRHYGMHLGPTLYPAYQSHYVEDRTPRCPKPNWYYDLEDHLRDRVDDQTRPWSWTVLRPSFLLGALRNGRHNLGTALGAYVALTAALEMPLDFLGDQRSASITTDLTSAAQLAQAARWSADSPNADGQAFNVATGQSFRWRDLWPAFVASQNRQGSVTPDGVRFASLAARHRETWQTLAHRENLSEPDLEVLASPGYADQMMLLDWDATFSIAKLQQAGFDQFPQPIQVLRDLITDMETLRLIPTQPER